jgi:hypothetical protein
LINLVSVLVDGLKPCWSSPQVYGWLGAFFTKECPRICQSKDRKQTAKVLYLPTGLTLCEALIA